MPSFTIPADFDEFDLPGETPVETHGVVQGRVRVAGYATGHGGAGSATAYCVSEGSFELSGAAQGGGEQGSAAGSFAVVGEAYHIDALHAVSINTTFALTGVATGRVWNTSSGSFALQGEANAMYHLGEVNLIGSASGSFALVGSAGADMFTPQFAYADGWTTVHGFSFASWHEYTSAAGVVTAPIGYAANFNYREVKGVIQVVGRASESATLSFPGYANLTSSPGTLFGVGHNSPLYGFQATHGGDYALTARGGARAALTGSAPHLTISATVTTIGRAELTSSAGTLSASGTVRTMGRAALAHRGQYSVLGRSGGIAVLDAPVGTLLAHGVASVVGAAELTSSAGTLIASGFATNIGRAELTSGAMYATPYSSLRATGPRGQLVATGYIVLSTSYEAYSITLLELQNGQTGIAATRFTDYPFERLLRWKDSYYGLGTDGLFELTGDEFDEAPIVAEVETAATDFGRREHKRATALYLSGRVGSDMDVSAISSEVESNTYYTYRPVSKDDASTHRVQFGRGIKYTYIGYRFTNVNGEDFSLTGFTPEVDTLKRSI